VAKWIYNRWQGYSVADCDCCYCLHYGGTDGDSTLCLAGRCVCETERAEALRREAQRPLGEKPGDTQ